MQRYTRRAPALLLIALIAVGAFGIVAPAASVRADSTNGTDQPAAQPAAKPTTPGAAYNPVPLKDGVDNGAAYGYLMTRIMSLFAWLLGAATLMLDAAVYYGVVVMGSFVNKLSAVGVTWNILRNIGNIMLIFGFILAGIAVIINYNVFGYGSKMLPMLLVAAIFLNFSLFISEAIIDTGNLFATEIYKQISGGDIIGPSKLNDPDAVVNEGISNRIMSVLGLQSLYNVAANKSNTTLASSQQTLQYAPWYIGFLGIILFIVAAFVMFSLAFMIIARLVALIFLIAVAPIGFAGLAVPKLQNLASKWWSALIEQTITAPVLLLLLYIALAVITDAKFLTGLGTAPDAQVVQCGWGGFLSLETVTGCTKNGVVQFAALLITFFVAMGLLLAVVVFAKRMSAFGAGWATRTSGRIMGGAIGYGLIGGASLAGRVGLGGLGRAMNTRYVRSQAVNAKTVGGRVFARTLAFTGRNLEGRTFDLRQSRLAQRAGGLAQKGLGAKMFGETTGLETIAAGMGKGATITAKSVTESARQAWKKVSPLHGFEGSWWRDQQKAYEKAADELARKQNLVPLDERTFATATARTLAEQELQKAVQKMSVDELAELRGIRKGIQEFVTALSPDKYDNLQKSDKLLATEKANLKSGWENQFTTPAGARAALRRFKPQEVAALDGQILRKPHVALQLNANDWDAIRRKDDLKDDQRHDIYDAFMHDPVRYVEFEDYLNADPSGARRNYWAV